MSAPVRGLAARESNLHASQRRETAIAFRGVCKSFDGIGAAPVLSNIELEVWKGEIFCLMGTSGSGKSTLLRHVNRLIAPTEGSVLVHDVPLESLTPDSLRALRSRRVGMVFQQFGLLPHRTALENVLLPLELRGADDAEARRLAEAQLRLVGLGDALDKMPWELSGGMQQRVGLARALVGQPDILLMDEPFGALDPTIRRDLQDQVRNLVRARGITTVLVTHDPAEALHLADRIALLREGRIVQVGTPQEILRAPADEWVADFFKGFGAGPALSRGPIAEQRIEHAPSASQSEPQVGRRKAFVDALLGPSCFAGTIWPLFWTWLIAEGLLVGLVAPALAQGSGWLCLGLSFLFLLASRLAVAAQGGARRREVRQAVPALALVLVVLGFLVWRAMAGDDAVRQVGAWSDRSNTIAVSGWIDAGIAWMQRNLQSGFVVVSVGVRSTVEGIEELLNWFSWPVPVAVLLYAAYRFAGVPVFLLSLAASAYLVLFGFWPQTVSTLALVGTAVFLTLVLGLPIGILLARSRSAQRVVSPMLDIMQTLPSFVYLIPAVAFFSVGKAPAVIATIIFAMPPLIQLTALGMQQVPTAAVEAAVAHGANAWQTLAKVELPLATRSILVGVNQTIVMSLSMVVVSALIGAGGLGYDVVTALRNIQGGAGFLAGIAIVFCAIVPDPYQAKFTSTILEAARFS